MSGSARTVAVLAGLIASALPSKGQQLSLGGMAVMDITITGQPSIPREALLSWIESAGNAVVAYFGRYPVPRITLAVRVEGSGAVGSGVARGGAAPSIQIALGNEADQDDLEHDWRLTHEMVHLAFPDLTSDDAWAEEGLATYVEPLARARVGALSVDKVWSDLIEGLPPGLPGRHDRGLHGTKDWGRTYWGGALFWLLADIGIRERTHNRQGLPDALAGVLLAGGDIRARWDLRRTLEVGDRTVRASVLSALYKEYGAARGNIDIATLWKRLGVRKVRDRVVYGDTAPLTEVRRAIVAAPDEVRAHMVLEARSVR